MVFVLGLRVYGLRKLKLTFNNGPVHSTHRTVDGQRVYSPQYLEDQGT